MSEEWAEAKVAITLVPVVSLGLDGIVAGVLQGAV